MREHTGDARWGAHAQALHAGTMWNTPRGGGHDDKAHPPIHPTRCIATDPGQAERGRNGPFRVPWALLIVPKAPLLVAGPGQGNMGSCCASSPALCIKIERMEGAMGMHRCRPANTAKEYIVLAGRITREGCR